MNKATYQVHFERVKFLIAWIKLRLGADFLRWDNCGNHTIAATIANTAQTPKKQSQPKPASSANGTLKPTAKAAPNAITLAYKLVLNSEFLEKLRLIKLGSNTFPKAMAIP
jgi:hypothetical protein